MLGFCSRFLARFPTTWPVCMGILHQHITFCLRAIAYNPTTSTGIFSMVTLSIYFKDIPILTTCAFLASLLIVAAIFPYISNCGVMISSSSSDCTLNLSAVHPTAHIFQHFPSKLPHFLSVSQCEFGFGRSHRPTYWITTRNTPSFRESGFRLLSEWLRFGVSLSLWRSSPGHMQVCSPSL